MPKRVTNRQINANRRNARKSTGPKTAEGKRRSSRNALKHGLLAREVVIREGDGAETQADFDALLADLCDELRPKGIIEETLVERIATCYWRLRRAQRYEVGAIRNSLDECNRPQDEPDTETAADVHDRLEQAKAHLAQHQRILDVLQDPPDLTDPDTFASLLPALDRIAADRGLSSFQPPPPPTRAELVRTILTPDDQGHPFEREPQARQAFLANLEQLGLNPSRLHRALIKAQRTIVADHHTRIADLQTELETARRYDRFRQSRRPLAGSLPAHDGLIKLVRYETMLDRQLHRALIQLHQRRADRPDTDPGDPPTPGGPHHPDQTTRDGDKRGLPNEPIHRPDAPSRRSKRHLTAPATAAHPAATRLTPGPLLW